MAVELDAAIIPFFPPIKMYNVSIPPPESVDDLNQLGQIACGENFVCLYWRPSHRQVLFQMECNMWYIQPGDATICESLTELFGYAFKLKADQSMSVYYEGSPYIRQYKMHENYRWADFGDCGLVLECALNL
jgi:hypothetical protein